MESLLTRNLASACFYFKSAPFPARSTGFCSSMRLHPYPSLSFPRAIALPRRSLTRPVVALPASHQNSHSESGADFDFDAEKVQESSKQVLINSFKEQALTMKNTLKDAYEESSKKALVALNGTLKILKIQAGKARKDLEDLVLVAQELCEEGEEYIATVAQNYPQEDEQIGVKFTYPSDDFQDDVFFGVPYENSLKNIVLEILSRSSQRQAPEA